MQAFEIKEGFRFNGSHSSEFGLRLIERIADPPAEKDVRENIPFMQGDLDFSGIMGVRYFENRELVYVFELVDYNYESRKVDRTFLTNWLMSGGRQKLYDDHDRGYYYKAKCTAIETVDNYHGTSYRITFDGYPFKIDELPEGNDIWDSFNFLLDYAQVTKFEIKGSETIRLFNPGANLAIPVIKASAPFTIRKNNITYNIPQGESKSHEFFLPSGENVLTVQGSGSIEFIFNKELI